MTIHPVGPISREEKKMMTLKLILFCVQVLGIMALILCLIDSWLLSRRIRQEVKGVRESLAEFRSVLPSTTARRTPNDGGMAAVRPASIAQKFGDDIV